MKSAPSTENAPTTPSIALITKDPSEMTLALGDLLGGNKLDYEVFAYGPEEVVIHFAPPDSPTVWRKWGFEALHMNIVIIFLQTDQNG